MLKLRGQDITKGYTLGDYCLGGSFAVERIDPWPHRTAAGEWARSAYDHAGRGLVIFAEDLYPIVSTP